MIDQQPHDPPPMTIRRADPGDDVALEQVAALDGRSLGQAPLLVAVYDDTIVAALSLVDGTVVADPFRFTLEAVELLRDRAKQLRAPERPAARALRVLANTTVAWAVAAAILTLGLAGVSTAQAAPRPALPAGTWVGSGTAGGASSEGGMDSTFRARLRFTIVIGSDGRVHGRGTFATAMTVTGAISSSVSSTAPVAFRGTSADIAYAGTATTRATFGAATRTLKPIAIRQRLPITRAGQCKAQGSFMLNGVAFRWSAARTVPGTCRT